MPQNSRNFLKADVANTGFSIRFHFFSLLFSAFRPKSFSSCRHSALRHSGLSAFRPKMCSAFRPFGIPSASRPKYYIGRPTGGVSLLNAATAVVVAVTVAAQRRGHVKERGRRRLRRRMQTTIISRPTMVIRPTERTTTTANDGQF